MAEPGPDRVMYALAVMTFMYVWRLQEIITPLGAIRAPLLMTGVAVGLFLLDRNPGRRLSELDLPISRMLLGLLAILVVGVPFAIWPGKSFTFLTGDLFPTVALMTMIAASVRTLRDLEWFAWTNLLGALMYATFVFLSFDVGHDGRLGNLVYYDSNDFGLLLVMSLPMAVLWFRRGAPRTRRLVALGALGLFMVTLVETGSRGGFLGFVAVAMFILVGYRALSKRARLTAVVVGGLLLTLGGSDAYWNQMRTLLNPSQDYNWSGQTESGRMEIWKRGMGYMARSPIVGVGARNFPQAEGNSAIARSRASVGSGFKWSAAHNSFVEIGAEGGVIALGLFLAILASAMLMLRRIGALWKLRPGAPGREVVLAQTLLASLIGYVVSGFFLSAAYLAYLYVILGLVLGLIKLMKRGPGGAPQQPVAATGSFTRMRGRPLPVGR